MSINAFFAIIGGIFLGGAVGLFIAYIKRDEEARVWLRLGLAGCAAVGVACVMLSFMARECPDCGRVVEGNYCEECGQQVRSEEYPAELFCLECGADISDDSNFCGQCGTPVKE